MPRTSPLWPPSWRALFPPPVTAADLLQTYEINRGRPEARCLIRFDLSPDQVGFPGAVSGARLTRFVDRKDKPPQKVETEWLVSSRAAADLPAQAMLLADRRYWGIENGLHLRLDVTAGEDRSRVRGTRGALNLAMMRRAVVSVAVHWIQHCRNQRQATLQGFYDFMAAKNSKKAFSLVTACKPSWLPPI